MLHSNAAPRLEWRSDFGRMVASKARTRSEGTVNEHHARIHRLRAALLLLVRPGKGARLSLRPRGPRRHGLARRAGAQQLPVCTLGHRPRVRDSHRAGQLRALTSSWLMTATDARRWASLCRARWAPAPRSRCG